MPKSLQKQRLRGNSEKMFYASSRWYQAPKAVRVKHKGPFQKASFVFCQSRETHRANMKRE